MIKSTDPKDPMCCVLVYNEGVVLVAQCNKFQQTSTSFTLETFDTMEELEKRIKELGLKYPKDWEY